MSCFCGDTECPSCGTAQGTLTPRQTPPIANVVDEPRDSKAPTPTIAVRRMLPNSFGYKWEAKLHKGSGGYARYGKTPHEALEKLQADKDCEGVPVEIITDAPRTKAEILKSLKEVTYA